MFRTLKYLVPAALVLACGSSVLACGPAYYPSYQYSGYAPTVIVVVTPGCGSGTVSNVSNNSRASNNAANNSRASNNAANNSRASNNKSSNAANNSRTSNAAANNVSNSAR